jgi:sigma-E factor negative regulatory protein RseB
MLSHSSRVAAVVSLSLGAVAVALAADDPRAWLERMERALATRNYQGTFVHEHGGQTDTLHVVHRVDAAGVAERIQAMDGSGREFVRRGGEVSTYFPDQRVVMVEGAPQQGLLLAELLQLDELAPQLYRLSEAPETRISGRDAHVIDVEPRDDLRYGYRVWIDGASAMPLKTQLRSAAGAVVEQIVFTELSLPVHIDDSALQPPFDARAWRWLRHDSVAVAAADRATPKVTWQAGQLPAGFRMTARSTRLLPGASQTVTHLVFSDGLASVSVFVEESAVDAAAVHHGAPGHQSATLTTLGSSSALSTTVNGHRVTAIGEVPAGTVRAIAASLRATGAYGGPGAVSPAVPRPGGGPPH